MRLIFPALLIAFSAHAEIPEGVFTELALFQSETGLTLSKEYIQNFPSRIEKLSVESESLMKMPEKDCLPQITVHIRHAISNSTDPVIMEFEDGLIKIETTACLPKASAEAVIKKLSDSQFRKETISTIKQTYQHQNWSCEVTSAPTFGKSNYCSLNYYQLSPAFSTARSFNIWNHPDRQAFELPIYFRSVFETATQTQNNTVYHMITYIRANRLTLAQRMFASGFILDMEKSVLSKLKTAVE